MSDHLGPRFFGEPWLSGVCESGQRERTPIGERCELCGDVIVDGDQGVLVLANSPNGWCLHAQHRECVLRSVVGGIGHFRDHDHWCDLNGDPDGGLSYRESALAVWEHVPR